jgi:hypothetical protein
MKMAPRPSTLNTRTVPPWASTKVRAIQSPSPRPGYERAGTTRVKRSNIRWWSQGLIPMPRSRTSMAT